MAEILPGWSDVERELTEAWLEEALVLPSAADTGSPSVCVHEGQVWAIEFDYVDEVEPPADQPADWQDIAIPEELLSRLRRAVQLYNISEIEMGLDELGQLGGQHQRLSEHLNGLKQNYDMDAMLAVLEEVRH